MVRFFAATIVLGMLLSVSPVDMALAQETQDEPETEETPAEEEITQDDLLESLGDVHGKRGRRLFKTAYWAAGLEGDMKDVYDTYGYPSNRYREVKAGVMLEKWTYLEPGKQFVFRYGKLMRTRRFNSDSALGIYLR